MRYKFIQINNSCFVSHLSESTIFKYKDKLTKIDEEIHALLADCPNFHGIDFTEDSHGINMRGHHIEIPRYPYGSEVKLNKDLSYSEECVQRFVQEWREEDNPRTFRMYFDFLKDGEKYGWD